MKDKTFAMPFAGNLEATKPRRKTSFPMKTRTSAKVCSAGEKKKPNLRSDGTKTAHDPQPCPLMITFPNAKINLGLNILERRPDGFHNIESLLLPITLYDILEVIQAKNGQPSFTSSGLEIPSNGKPNLCQQAALLMKKKYGIPDVSIHLHKNIPMGAGLGGVSADAAFTLKLINQLFSLQISSNALKKLAEKLGSDCPFFIENKPILVSGRGEQLESFSIDLSGLSLFVVNPHIHVSTAKAYAGVKPVIPEIPLREALNQPLENWKYFLKNDFEVSIFKKHPILDQIKQEFYLAGALYASMSGSGSAMFGIFKETPSKNFLKSFPMANARIELNVG